MIRSNPGAIVQASHPPPPSPSPHFLRAIRKARNPNLHIDGQTCIKISEA